MKFLFYDFECSNCFNGKGKICEYGYVITDTNFKLIQKGVKAMSPGRGADFRFKLNPNSKHGISLAYDERYYFDQKEFPAYYDFIYKHLTNDETMAFAYSCENDIGYLQYTCERYKKLHPNYTVIDVQVLLQKEIVKSKNLISLENAFELLCSHQELMNLTPHLSRDDAFMTMRILQNLLIKLNVSLEELIDRNPSCVYESHAYIEMINERKRLKAERRRIKAELLYSGNK